MTMIRIEAFKVKNAMKKVIDLMSEGDSDFFEEEFYRSFYQKAVDAENFGDGYLFLEWHELNEISDYL